MRIYGSSPLFNYVELFFRCKRMFIIAILLGTVITASLVSLRTKQYETSMVVALSGRPDLNLVNSNTEANMSSPAVRKVNRLNFWIHNEPDFLENALKTGNFDQGRSPEAFAELVRSVRTKIDGPKWVLGDQYAEVSLVWPDAKEAEAILNQIFSLFRQRTIVAETDETAQLVDVLSQQLTDASKDADIAASKRVVFQSHNYFALSNLLGMQMTHYDSTLQEVANTQTNIVEAQTRLNEVNRQLAGTKQYEDRTTGSTEHVEDAAYKYAAEKDDLTKQLNEALQRYAEAHPKVIDLRRKIAALDQQIKDAMNAPKRAKDVDITKTTVLSPRWLSLRQQKDEFEQTVHMQQVRLAMLNKQLAINRERVKEMPGKEVEDKRTEQDYMLKDTVRRNIAARLAQAQLDDRQAKALETKTVMQAVPPRSEPMDTSGKKVLFYALGPLLGIVIAFGFSLIAEALDHTLRTPVEVEKYLGKPVLAVIPRMTPARPSRKAISGQSNPKISS